MLAAAAFVGAARLTAEPLPSPASAQPPAGVGVMPQLGPLDEGTDAAPVLGSGVANDGLGPIFSLDDDPNARIVSIVDDSASLSNDDLYAWQLMPQGLIYRSYMAGAKESRLSGIWNNDASDGNLWDVCLGGQVGVLRFGTAGNARPEGIQLGMEGAAQTRLDRDENLDLEATDYRFGIPLTWGNARVQTKFAFYHLSSHLADEFLIKHPGFTRLNYSRNVLVYGKSVYATPRLRFYGEAGYGFDVDVAKEWEFQFGFDYGPYGATSGRGEPFFAVNGQLREEVDYGGNFVAQAGWAWRRSPASGMLRTGVSYYTGKQDQFSFFNDSQQKVGYGIWYDY